MSNRRRTAQKRGPVDVIIDTPRGSRCKYKLDKSTGQFRLGKLLPRGASFPYNFGFIPGTIGEDGDAIDVLVLLDEPLFVGCCAPVRIIGVLEATQSEKRRKAIRNDRLIGVVETEYNPPEWQSVQDLIEQQRKELEHFFVSYNQIEDRHFRCIGWGNVEQALKLIAKGSRTSP
jgi:inorganic pyrophosphatase